MGKKNLLSIKRAYAIINAENMSKVKFKDCAICGVATGVAGAVGGAVAGGLAGANKLYPNKVGERIPQIQEEMLKIAQGKATEFNELMGKYDIKIPIPTEAGKFEFRTFQGDGIDTVSSGAIEEVRQNILGTISNDLINVGNTKSMVHIGRHNIVLDASNTEPLIRSTAGDSTFDAYKFLIEQMGNGLDANLVDVANTIAPYENEIINTAVTWAGICGLGLLSLSCIAPLGFKVAEKYFERKAKKYEKEYEECFE